MIDALVKVGGERLLAYSDVGEVPALASALVASHRPIDPSG